ncbi:hypothetical protein AB0451_39975 [Streptomyces sp. NPDC052000]|uniref:hypothetical protein n=1 Tax=Streptomyces sp. NPDC052000 TaxID=3155676 RepID=UPI003450EF04
MTRPRHVYCMDYSEDFGLSGLTGTVCSRVGLRIDAQVILSVAQQLATEQEDHQLGADVRLLLDGPLSESALRDVWLAATRGCFDPTENGEGMRQWLQGISDVCPPHEEEADLPGAAGFDERGPQIGEEDLRGIVTAEIDYLVPKLQKAIPAPETLSALHDIVQHVDADLGLRMFLRTVKAYSVPVSAEQYDRLIQLAEQLAYHFSVVHESLNVRWPPIDPADRTLPLGRFGLPTLTRLFDADTWSGEGDPLNVVDQLLHADVGLTPGLQAAILLDDAQHAIDSSLPDSVIADLWLAASGRWYVRDEFDSQGRPWLHTIAQRCRNRLRDVDTTYMPYPASTPQEPRAAVLREIQASLATLNATYPACPSDGIAQGAGQALEQAAMVISPDLAFRLFLHCLTPDHPVTAEQYARFASLCNQLRYHENYIHEFAYLVAE